MNVFRCCGHLTNIYSGYAFLKVLREYLDFKWCKVHGHKIIHVYSDNKGIFYSNLFYIAGCLLRYDWKEKEIMVWTETNSTEEINPNFQNDNPNSVPNLTLPRFTLGMSLSYWYWHTESCCKYYFLIQMSFQIALYSNSNHCHRMSTLC